MARSFRSPGCYSLLWPERLRRTFSMVGSIPIFFMGVNLIRERTFNTADMLPAVLSRC